jgi:hypothetical protein
MHQHYSLTRELFKTLKKGKDFYTIKYTQPNKNVWIIVDIPISVMPLKYISNVEMSHNDLMKFRSIVRLIHKYNTQKNEQQRTKI